MFDRSVLGFDKEEPAKPAGPGYVSNNAFKKKFQNMLGKAAMVKNPPGVDLARGLGQAKAKVAGRNNAKRAKLATSIDPVAAAMQHSVRNRSTEQAGNASSITPSPAAGRNSTSSVYNFYGLK